MQEIFACAQCFPMQWTKRPVRHSRRALHATSGASADANTLAHTALVAGMHEFKKCLHVFNVLHCNGLKSPIRYLIFYVKKV